MSCVLSLIYYNCNWIHKYIWLLNPPHNLRQITGPAWKRTCNGNNTAATTPIESFTCKLCLSHVDQIDPQIGVPNKYLPFTRHKNFQEIYWFQEILLTILLIFRMFWEIFVHFYTFSGNFVKIHSHAWFIDNNETVASTHILTASLIQSISKNNMLWCCFIISVVLQVTWRRCH